MKTSRLGKVLVVVAPVVFVAATTAYLSGQAQPPAPAAPAGQTPGQAGRGGGRGNPQWGRGPISVMLVTKGHGFNPREEFFQMFDSFGSDIRWSSVEHPAAEYMLSPRFSEPFDVYVFYDRAGEGFSTQPRAGGPAPIVPKDAKLVSNDRYYPQPPKELKEELRKLLRAGNKGFVFLHHSNSSWVQVWPEYSEVVGSACDWDSPVTVRGIEHPPMGFFGNTLQKMTIVDKAHPITKGVDDFEITDESYNCVFFEEAVHPLIRTDFDPKNAPPQRNGAPPRMLNPKVASSNLVSYVKAAEISPVAYIQMGHNATGWTNPNFRQLVVNAIQWAASPEARAWAKANPKKIFK